MSETIDINAAAEVVMNAEESALKAMRSLLDTFLTNIEGVQATLPLALALDASRIATEIRNNLSYVKNSSLPMAIRKYEPDAVNGVGPEYLPPLG